MVGKMPNVTWLDGSFAETVKGWQSGWFYITEPSRANWAAALPRRSREKLVVVDSREVVVLRPRRTSTPEQ